MHGLHAGRRLSTDLDSKLLGFQVCSHVLQLPVEQRPCCGANRASLQAQQGFWTGQGREIKMRCPDALIVGSMACSLQHDGSCRVGEKTWQMEGSMPIPCWMAGSDAVMPADCSCAQQQLGRLAWQQPPSKVPGHKAAG